MFQILRHFKSQSAYFCFSLSGISKGKGNYLDEVLDLGYAYLNNSPKTKQNKTYTIKTYTYQWQ